MDNFFETHCLEVFDDGEWSIYLKERNNVHPGKPSLKVWVCRHGREVAQLCERYRGYGMFLDHEELIPKEVRKKAHKTWKKLCEGYYTEEKLKKLRADFIERHNKAKPLIIK